MIQWKFTFFLLWLAFVHFVHSTRCSRSLPCMYGAYSSRPTTAHPLNMSTFATTMADFRSVFCLLVHLLHSNVQGKKIRPIKVIRSFCISFWETKTSLFFSCQHSCAQLIYTRWGPRMACTLSVHWHSVIHSSRLLGWEIINVGHTKVMFFQQLCSILCFSCDLSVHAQCVCFVWILSTWCS